MRFPHGWPFPDPPNAAAFTTRQVAREGRPVRLVTHDADGSWQFHTGEPVSAADGMVVCLEELLKLDPTLADLGGLPRGRRAARRPDGTWERSESEP